MPGKKGNQNKKGVSFQLVPKGREETNYEDDTAASVWAPTADIRRLAPRAYAKQNRQRANPDEESEGDELDEDAQALLDEMEEEEEDYDGDGSSSVASSKSGGSSSSKRSARKGAAAAAAAKAKQEEDDEDEEDEKDEDEDEPMFEDIAEGDLDDDFVKQMMYAKPSGQEDAEDRRLRGQTEKPRYAPGGGILRRAGGGSSSSSRSSRAGDDDEGEEYYDEGDDMDDDEINAMMEEGDEEEEDDSADYPQHDTNGRAIDRQFSRMMNEFEADENLNDYEESDPRAMGAVAVEQYAPLLEEFLDGHVQHDMLDNQLSHKGLLNGLRQLSRENRVFDHAKAGDFMMTRLPDKATRLREALRSDPEESRAITLRLLAEQEEAARQGMTHPEPPLDPPDYKQGPRERAAHDCETVLTTHSTLYNHPNVIAATKKKLNPQAAVRRLQRERAEKQQQAKNGPNQIGAARRDEQPQQHKQQKGHGLVGATDAANGNAPARLTSANLSAKEAEIKKEEQRPQQCCSSDGVRANDNGSDVDGEEEEETESVAIDLTSRPKGESADDKKVRRQLVKQMQRDKRAQKKAVGTAFKGATTAQTQRAGITKQQKAQMTLSMGRH